LRKGRNNRSKERGEKIEKEEIVYRGRGRGKRREIKRERQRKGEGVVEHTQQSSNNRNSTDRISNAAYLRLILRGEILLPPLYYNPNNYPFPQIFISTKPCYVKGTSTNGSLLIKGLSLYTYTLFSPNSITHI